MWHRSGSILAQPQVMACCLMALSLPKPMLTCHLCWTHLRQITQEVLKISVHKMSLKNKFKSTSPSSQWVESSFCFWFICDNPRHLNNKYILIAYSWKHKLLNTLCFADVLWQQRKQLCLSSVIAFALINGTKLSLWPTKPLWNHLIYISRI